MRRTRVPVYNTHLRPLSACDTFTHALALRRCAEYIAPIKPRVEADDDTSNFDDYGDVPQPEVRARVRENCTPRMFARHAETSSRATPDTITHRCTG